MTAYEKRKELQITLPVAEAAVAAFVPTVRTGNLLFVSGHIAKRNIKMLCLVNSSPNFTEQHLVANGAFELLQEL
jgi:enamine deaminase RidA (YjgF/YER057c/UK114 family)